MKNSRQAGFTVFELTVVVPTFLLVIAVLFSFLMSIYGQLLVKDAKVTMALEAQTALSSIQDDLFFARNFAEMPSASIADANAPSGDWTFNTSPNNTLIVYQVALDKAYQSSDRQIISQGPPPCDSNSTPVLTNLIYYIDAQNRLRRRVLVPDPNQERCTEPFLKQTCPTDGTRQQQNADGTTSTVPCLADVTLAKNITSFTVDYYDANGALINLGAGGSPLQAERITIKLAMRGTGLAQNVTNSAELSIKKINRGDPNIQ